MKGISLIKAVVMATFFLAPTGATAASLFDDGTHATGFEILPFWNRIAADMRVTAASETFAVPSNTSRSTHAPLNISTNANSSLHPSSPSVPCADERHCVPGAWTDFLSGLRGLEPYAQLQAVNSWANAKPYVDDMINWRLPDYWETPGEFIAHGGDCEDFAIAKYFSLIRLGFSRHDLRIVIVSDSRAHDFHAVLVARIAHTVWLLDNQLADVTPLAAMPQYTPIYSLNEEGWWLYTQPVIHVSGDMTIAAAPLPAAPAIRVAATN